MKLVAIDAPYFYAGVVLDDDLKVTDAAPILQWTIGKHWDEVARWCTRKNFKVTVAECQPCSGSELSLDFSSGQTSACFSWPAWSWRSAPTKPKPS
jgi:hypothetical protein